jgi:NADH-quinone oxidoreductase subunit C
MSEALNELGEHVRNALPEAVLSAKVALGELVVAVHRGSIVKVLTFLRDDASCQFRLLVDVCGVDYPER